MECIPALSALHDIEQMTYFITSSMQTVIVPCPVIMMDDNDLQAISTVSFLASTRSARQLHEIIGAKHKRARSRTEPRLLPTFSPGLTDDKHPARFTQAVDVIPGFCELSCSCSTNILGQSLLDINNLVCCCFHATAGRVLWESSAPL